MNWVEIARFNSRLEAETVGHALDQYEIPFVVQSADIGIFGPGMVGSSPVGASLQVPEERVAEVRELLDCVVRDASEAADEASERSVTTGVSKPDEA